MKALIMWMLGILAASAASQTIEVSGPIESVAFTDSSDRVIVKCPAGRASYDCFAIDANNPRAVFLGNFHTITCSNDGTIAVGCKFEIQDVIVIDTHDGRQTITGLKGVRVFFEPAGHRFAVQEDFTNARCAIDLFNPDTFDLRKLSRFAADVLGSPKGKYAGDIEIPDRDRIGIELLGWDEEGLKVEEVIHRHTGMRGHDFIVHPETDKARPKPRTQTVLERKYSIYHDKEKGELLDKQNGYAVMFSRARNGSGLSFSVVNGPYRDLAKKAEIMVLGGITDDGGHAEIWVVNTRSYKAKRIAAGECPIERKPGYQSLVISPDGKWVAYRDFSDPRKVILVRVSEDIAGSV